jgi:hypothetical protein
MDAKNYYRIHRISPLTLPETAESSAQLHILFKIHNFIYAKVSQTVSSVHSS